MKLFGSRKTNLNNVLKIMIRKNIIKQHIIKQNIIKQHIIKQNIIKQNLIDFGFALNGTINEDIGEFELLIFNGIDIQKIELTQTALRD